ncbi:MAG: hypothetical protein PHI12_06800 [Dehalococcoidales bacterium]|nr:hypothetical protein [Dehalococcoidales bacterium]
MPKYQTNKQRHERYEMIAKAEGDQCIFCYMGEGKKTGPPKSRLIIEHADNDKTNWSWRNIHLACYSHNKLAEKMNVRDKIKLLQQYSDQLERERERGGLPTWKSVLKEMIPYETGSPEMQANRRFETPWWNYVYGEVAKYGSVGQAEIIEDAAGACNCSIQTSSNYLRKHTSKTRAFKKGIDADGNKVVIFREKVREQSPKIISKVEPGKPAGENTAK